MSAAQSNGINTYNEKSLHAALKQVYALPGDQLEVNVDGYIIDLVRGDLLIEIQTGSFSPLKNKLARLVDTHPLRLVYPVPLEKWILTRFPGESAASTAQKVAQARVRCAGLCAAGLYPPADAQLQLLARSAAHARGRSAPPGTQETRAQQGLDDRRAPPA